MQKKVAQKRNSNKIKLELPLNSLLLRSIKASIEAGYEILKVYDTEFNVQYKDDDTPLTKADQNASNKIIELLADTGIPVLSEEGEHFTYEKRKQLEDIFIVDPLDGTKEFVKRNGEFTVNIALIHKNQPVIGVIFSPVFKDLYFAAKGIGSFKLDKHTFIELAYQIHDMSLEKIIMFSKKLPKQSYPEVYTVVASRSHLSAETYSHIEKLKHKHSEVNMVNTGSSIKMCWVAEGLADEYPRFGPTMEWDTAAGQCILENAGCELIDSETGQPMRYNREIILNNSFVARRKSTT